MKTMILAAGRGERMRPLSDAVPKPLLPLAGKPLLVHLIESLARTGLRDLVINHAHLGHQIVDYLGDGARFGVRVSYSHEIDGGLEVGGGIFNALSLIGSDPFVVVNGDIWTDYPFDRLPCTIAGSAHLVLIDNPPHHPAGDFLLAPDGQVQGQGRGLLTYSGIGVYRHALFNGCRPGKFPLAPLLRAAMTRGTVTGEHYRGRWYDIGTPERLAELDGELSRRSSG
ncbi:MAG TPA: nucleotidyltransferase family protein [Burkholderiales bacterium]|nr:nucleotidyltransferase family protein [Burkholderiales bacterium]